jgi:hypothetical protein
MAFEARRSLSRFNRSRSAGSISALGESDADQSLAVSCRACRGGQWKIGWIIFVMSDSL